MVKQSEQGVIIEIKITPKASQNEIMGWENGILKIRLKAVPEKGKANRELIRFLSKTFNIPQNNIHLLKGETSRLKTLCFLGKKAEELFEYINVKR